MSYSPYRGMLFSHFVSTAFLLLSLFVRITGQRYEKFTLRRNNSRLCRWIFLHTFCLPAFCRLCEAPAPGLIKTNRRFILPNQPFNFFFRRFILSERLSLSVKFKMQSFKRRNADVEGRKMVLQMMRI